MASVQPSDRGPWKACIGYCDQVQPRPLRPDSGSLAAAPHNFSLFFFIHLRLITKFYIYSPFYMPRVNNGKIKWYIYLSIILKFSRCVGQHLETWKGLYYSEVPTVAM